MDRIAVNNGFGMLKVVLHTLTASRVGGVHGNPIIKDVISLDPITQMIIFDGVIVEVGSCFVEGVFVRSVVGVVELWNHNDIINIDHPVPWNEEGDSCCDEGISLE